MIMQMMVVILTSLVALVSGDCPDRCHCSSYKILCTLARLNTVPSGLPSTTEHVRVLLDHIPRLNNSVIHHLHNLTRLELINVQLREIERASFQTFNRLQHLTITENNISTLTSNSFQFLDNLYYLNLSANGIVTMESGTFSGLANLYFLDLSHNNIYILPSGLFSIFQNLRHLDISQNEIKLFHRHTFDGMRNISNCNLIKTPKRLYLFQKFKTEIEPETFKDLCFTHLNLGFSKLNESLSNLQGITKLKISIPFEKFTFDIMNSLKDLLHLDMSNGNIQILEKSSQDNLKFVKHLDLSINLISKIQPGAFKGFVSLKILTLKDNNLSPLLVNTFEGLNSLQMLFMSRCRISIIKPGAFNGLAALQILDLSHNMIPILKNNTFSGLANLRELNLYHNYITHIETGAFIGLRSLRNLSNYLYHFSLYSTNSMLGIDNKTLETFERIDSLALSPPLASLEKLQVLRTLHLYIDAMSYNPQQVLQEIFHNVGNVTIFKLTLLRINSLKMITSFTEHHISTIYIFKSNLHVLDNTSFTGLSSLKSLTIDNCKITTLERETFYQMKSLTEVILIYNSQLIFKPGSFIGLDNLEKLNLNHNGISILNNGTFSGLENLKQLQLSYNKLKFINAGIFHHLRNIQEIDLHRNKIHTIPAGVFGAVCNEQFQLSCGTLTSLQHCNISNALISLQRLDISWNNITYIHPHAFISCTNLHTLILSKNKLLTLKNSFLYTPRLRNLEMNWCNISKIPNNIFKCTPLLSKIDLSQNKINKLNVISLLSVKKLETINISWNPLLCDCQFYKTWIWLHENHVHFSIKGYELHCGNRNIDSVISNFNCNDTSLLQTRLEWDISESIKEFNPSTTTTKDFIYKLYLQPLVLMNIFILGIASNGVILFISLCNSDMCTKQNIIIIHLAIVNIFSLMLNFPLNYWDVLNLKWELNEVVCKILIMAKDVMVSVTVFSAVALSLERYIAAHTLNMKNSNYLSRKVTIILLLIIAWVFAILISLPSLILATVDTRCLYCPSGYEFYIKCVWVLQFIISCFMPAVIITHFNANTIHILKGSVHDVPEFNHRLHMKGRKCVDNALLIVTFMFVFSYQPNFLVRAFFSLFRTDIENLFVTSLLSFCLFFCNTIFIPISVLIMNSKYKFHTLNYIAVLTNERKSYPDTRNQESESGDQTTHSPAFINRIKKPRMKSHSKLRKYLTGKFNTSYDDAPDSGIELQVMNRHALMEDN